ncbi:MAG: type II toxin-antitoxin system RelE/ParE family toxin [Hyphomicrobiales bacterium]|nr:type II toxin-antitoxin system RelE/ParE family toxin [Hyphomicrobiales bacterium]
MHGKLPRSRPGSAPPIAATSRLTRRSRASSGNIRPKVEGALDETGAGRPGSDSRFCRPRQSARRLASAEPRRWNRRRGRDLRAHPHMGRPGRIVGTRELVVAETAYVVPYRVADREVQIPAVFHGARCWPDKLV